MVNNSETPFESIESTHEYVGFIVEAVEEAKASILEDLARNQQGSDRRHDALRVIHYKLDQLQRHLLDSRRLLNDLRTLRRLLLRERASSQDAESAVEVSAGNDPSPSRTNPFK